ncbi:hypothetical protein EDB89DRAFT_2190372 [Lactarius sanguifluus]|nr:hypothetical protein EDB89DRAFT_2190372 [Lactarius sanguifluus]
MSEPNQENEQGNENSGIKFHATSVLVCPDCNEGVCVGFGGKKNLAIHRTSKACQRKQQGTESSKSKGPKRAPERPPKPDRPNHDLRTFFKPRVPLVPPTVVAPPLIHTDETSFSGLSDNLEVDLEVLETHARVPLATPPSTSGAGNTQGKTPCQKGIDLLNKLEAALTRIPDSVPLATSEHRLSIFSANPHSCVASLEQGPEVDLEDDWMVLNSMLKTAFGWGESEMRENTKEMLNRGAHGLDGLIQFLKYFVLQRGLEGAMIETKVNGLLCEIDNQYAPVPIPAPQSISAGTVATKKVTASVRKTDSVLMPALAIASGTVESPIVLDHVPDRATEACFDARSNVTERPRDICTDGMDRTTQSLSGVRIGASVEGRRGACCEGILVQFPHGKNHHISYPFGIHSERDLPWDYRSTRDKFYIQAKLCRRPSISKGNACNDCQALTSVPLYISIMDRIRNGVHENTPLIYHGIGGLVEVAQRKTEQVRQLRLTKLNASRRLLGKATALDDHKQWIMAIASGRVDRVASLVQAGLKHKAGIKTLIQQYERAAEKLYQPKGYSNEDLMRSIVMLRLGGARVAEFAHRSLSLPSVTTIRRNTVLQSLIVSPSVPTVGEVERNIMSCHSGLAGIGDTLDLALDSGTSSGGLQVVHQVIMFDELAIEQRVRWDDSTNKFLGICREHGHEIPLDEATVAGIGTLSEVPREYSVRPIMFSGTCKRETGPHHARVLQVVLEAANKVKVRKNCTYRTVCVASDGEAKRGDAFVILTMSSQLSASSPIYGQLSSLKLMNHLVGPDDLTADKDFKHVFKRQRNLLMRQKGVLIQGFCVTPAILRTHLESHGFPSHRLRSLLNPNDKQDVVLAYSLLKEVWSLPPPPAGSSPSFARAREALNVYGKFAHHLMTPYVCVDLNLDEQLIHLSAAAHMAFFLYRDCLARTQFMPTQSYVDIMIMVKNVFYCVAKAKVDNPHGNFYPILLGTDHLETFFGLIRTAVGTDANVDVLQLGNRASGLTEVALILAEHPEWDLGPRRLTLPRITNDAQAGEITSKFDHISPKDWRGDATVARVNLHSCWLLGRQQAITCIPGAGRVFEQLLAEGAPNIDMLSPLGTLLVNQRDQEHDSEDNTDDFASSLDPEGTEHIPSDAMQNANNTRTTLSLPLSYTHDGDLEDAIADEMPRNNVDSTIFIQGQKTSKAKALRHRMASRTTRSSTDRLRRVQNIPCFGPTSAGTAESDSWSGSITPCDDTTLGPTLRVGNPVALLVLVNRLRFASQSNLDELAVHLLADPTAKVDCQLLRLVPATVEDDPTRVHDWCWSMQMEANCENIDGRYVHSLNPAISILRPGKPTFLFEGSFLVTLSCSLFQDLRSQDYQSLPVLRRTEFFPYRFDGMACFVCDEKLTNYFETNSQGCSRCGSTMNRKNGQRVLEHMGAHILHDGLLDSSEELCGLCLRPALMCQIYLRKARGTAGSFSVDRKKSKCINMTHFNYATASTSSEASPCSNVPIICPRCPDDSPAVWTYSLHAHFREQHRIQSPDNFPITICLSQSEKDGMRKVWNSRFKAQKQRKTKPKNIPSLVVSEAHRAQLYLRSGTGDKENQEDDSGAHDVDFRGDPSDPPEDAMEWDPERESDDDDGDGGGDDGDDDGDRDDDDEEIEPTPPSSPTWYPNACVSPPPSPTPAPQIALKTAHTHGLNVLPIESSISALKSTTTPQESSAQAQAQALESSTQPSTQPSDLIAQPPESTAVKDVPLAIPTLAPLSHLPGPPSPSGALPEPAVSGRGRRLRKANVLSLNMFPSNVYGL